MSRGAIELSRTAVDPQSHPGHVVDHETERDNRPSNTYITAAGDTPSYSYVDCTLRENPSGNDPVNSQMAEPAMEEPCDGEIHDVKDLLYSHLDRGNAESNEAVADDGAQDYDLLDRTEKKDNLLQYGNDNAYQHIQPQVTLVDDDKNYQRLSRDAFH